MIATAGLGVALLAIAAAGAEPATHRSRVGGS
jgi:hypothetical protein